MFSRLSYILVLGSVALAACQDGAGEIDVSSASSSSWPQSRRDNINSE